MMTSDNISNVSIIVPTHGRYSLLVSLFNSLKIAAENFNNVVEIIIIDSSNEPDNLKIKELCVLNGYQYYYHRNNVREKRNIGIKNANGDIILFVDSDCVVYPDFISQHCKEYKNDIAGVLGITRFTGKESMLWKIISHSSITSSFTIAEREEYANWGPTCNISYKKEMFEKLGYFDTSFPFNLGGDDTDFGLRVTGAGYLLKCNPYAIVEHTKETWLSIKKISGRVFRWGRMHYYIIKKHSERTSVDYPKVPGLLFIVLIACIILSLIKNNSLYIFYPVGWLVLQLVIEIILLCSLPRHKFKNWRIELGARLINLLFETGTHWEGIKNGSILPFYKSGNYSAKSEEKNNRRITQFWAYYFSALIILLIV